MCYDADDVEPGAALATDVFDLGRKVDSFIHDETEELRLRVMVDWQAVHLEVVVLLSLGRPREDGVASLGHVHLEAVSSEPFFESMYMCCDSLAQCRRVVGGVSEVRGEIVCVQR